MDGPKELPNRSGDPRTDLAAERTKLAKERTFAAWIRTGLSSAGIGIALAKLVTRGFLPEASAFERDGWGDPFVPDPAAASPVVRVTSPTLAR